MQANKLNTMNTRAFLPPVHSVHIALVYLTSPEGLFASAAVEQNIKWLCTLRETILIKIAR